jgi:hypothetical protein
VKEAYPPEILMRRLPGLVAGLPGPQERYAPRASTAAAKNVEEPCERRRRIATTDAFGQTKRGRTASAAVSEERAARACEELSAAGRADILTLRRPSIPTVI